MDPSMPHMSSARWMWMPTEPPTIMRMLAWHPQPVPVLLVLTLLGTLVYLWGVIRLRRNGHPWSWAYTGSFLAGVATLVAFSATGLNGYAMSLFSVHMVQHMVLTMATPILLLMGRPVTLALRALPSGSRARHVVVWLLHSRLAKILTSIWFTLPMFIFTLYGLYFVAPLFDALMNNWAGHELMLLHFVLTGLFLFWPMLGLDPSPHPQPAPLRFVESLLPMPFHAFFGVTVMGATDLLVKTFAHPPMSWHVSPVADQQLGGGLAWGFAEIPSLALTLLLGVLWARESHREARRIDRSEARTDDSRLTAYNAMLATLSAQDEQAGH